MSGPMQWSQRLGRLVPAVGTLDLPESEPIPPGEVIEPKPRPSPPQLAPSQLTPPQNIVSLAKARLREVKAELRKMKALEKERAELERLIAAAKDKKPRTHLRAVTKSAG